MFPKYHQKLGCQANGGARAGRAPPRSANETGLQFDAFGYFGYFVPF